MKNQNQKRLTISLSTGLLCGLVTLGSPICNGTGSVSSPSDTSGYHTTQEGNTSENSDSMIMPLNDEDLLDKQPK